MNLTRGQNQRPLKPSNEPAITPSPKAPQAPHNNIHLNNDTQTSCNLESFIYNSIILVIKLSKLSLPRLFSKRIDAQKKEPILSFFLHKMWQNWIP